MEYVVDLKRTLTMTVVVEADSDDEAQAMIDGRMYKWKHIDYGNDWEYSRHIVCPEDEKLLLDRDDAMRMFGCSSEEEFSRTLYKATCSGVTASFGENELHITGCVDGMDGDGYSVTLKFPFTDVELSRTIRYVDTVNCDLWKEVNGDE